MILLDLVRQDQSRNKAFKFRAMMNFVSTIKHGIPRAFHYIHFILINIGNIHGLGSHDNLFQNNGMYPKSNNYDKEER